MRGHWGSENRSSHHVRDRASRCGEDDGRSRRSKPGIILARPRSFALNLLRANGATSVSAAVDANPPSLDRLLALGAE